MGNLYQQYILLALILWGSILLVFIKNSLETILLWQTKEYRFDRISAYFKYSNEDRIKNSNVYKFKNALLFLNLILFLIHSNFFIFISFFYLIGNILQSLNVLNKILGKKLKLPKIKSPRNILLIIFVGIVFTLFYFIIIQSLLQYISPTKISTESITSTDISNLFIQEQEIYSQDLIPFASLFFFMNIAFAQLIDILQPVIVAIGVLLTEPLAYIKRNLTIKKAKAKIDSLKNLKIIAITGSYGKTSTKEMLLQILEKKYKVIATPQNFNTTVGIAETILQLLNNTHEIFIAEMGAYRQGEIKKSTDLATPNISIITNVAKSHLDIFGTIENIANTKAEIIKGLKLRGTAILNADNKYTYEIGKDSKRKVLYFTNKDDNPNFSEENSVSISKINWDNDNVTFFLHFEGNKEKISTKLHGRHHLENLTAAITCCINLGLDLKEISKLIHDINFKSSHFSIYNGRNGSKIIDDGYNSNPAGFDAALKYLKDFDYKNKIILTKGIPEIKKEVHIIYKSLAPKIINSSDLLITTDKDLMKAVKNYSPNFRCRYVTEDRLMEEIESYLKKNTVILIEGRINPVLMNYLTKADNEN